MTPFVLLGIGLLLIFIEFYLPGAVIGVGGGLMVFASLVLFASENQNPLIILLYLIGVCVLVAILIKFTMWRIKTAKPSRSIYSNDSQQGFQASTFDTTQIGKTGVVVTDLRPGGYILIEGMRLQALSQSGYLVKGTEVEVIGGQEESLIVKLAKKEIEQ